MVVMELVVLRQGFAKHYGGGEGVGGGRGCARGRGVAAITSRKGGNGPGPASPLVPVQSRTGTNGGIGPGS